MIRTHYASEPWHAWIAWQDGAGPDDPQGRGQTEAEAIADLKKKIEEEKK